MNFDELKIVWNSEAKKPIFTIDEKGLAKSIIKENKRFNRSMFFRDAGELFVGLVACAYFIYKGASFAVEGASLGRAFSLIVLGILFLLLSGYRLGWSLIERKSRARYDYSVRSQIDKFIDDLDHQIDLLHSSKWTFAALLLIIPLFSYNIAVDESNLLLGIGTGVFLFILSLVGNFSCRRKVFRELLPKKKIFESLRDNLLGSDDAEMVT